MEIVQTSGFAKDVKRIGLVDLDVAALISTLVANPQAGDAIKGLKGVRKVRFGIPSRNIGKSGGGRAVYFLIEVRDRIVLLKAYGKTEKSDLTAEDRRAILKVIDDIGGE